MNIKSLCLQNVKKKGQDKPQVNRKCYVCGDKVPEAVDKAWDAVEDGMQLELLGMRMLC